jgi:FKBP-type peptidyl-prolyl cis-trans isomerase 2
MIDQGKKVKFNYTLRVGGEIVDQSKEAPLEYVHGEGGIIPGLQDGMKGMKQGEKKVIRVAADRAYGNIHPEAIVEVPKDRFPQEVTLGMPVGAKSPEGQSYQGRVVDIRPETILVDFNHPLAGKELEFDIEVVSIDA